MNRESFIFTIGYDGDSALVDSRAEKKYKNYTIAELADAGLFKPALSYAVFTGKKEDFDLVLEKYNDQTMQKVDSSDQLKMVLGVHRLPAEISKIARI